MAFNGFHAVSVPGSSSQEVADTQGKLVQLGYVLDVNGSYDAATSAAVLNFRQKMNLPIIDSIDGQFITALGMAGRPGYSAPISAGGIGGAFAVVYGIGVLLALPKSPHIVNALLWPLSAAESFQRKFPR